MKNQTYYFHTPGKQGENVKRYTIAGVIEGNTISIAASACGLNDQFVKKIGRSIALQRAQAVPYSRTTIEKSALPGLAFRQMAEVLAKKLISNELQVHEGRIFINPHLEKSNLKIVA